MRQALFNHITEVLLWFFLSYLCLVISAVPVRTKAQHYCVSALFALVKYMFLNGHGSASTVVNSSADDSGLAPTVCKNQAMIDEPGSYFCLPLSAQINTLAAVQTALPPPECADVSSAHCDKVDSLPALWMTLLLCCYDSCCRHQAFVPRNLVICCHCSLCAIHVMEAMQVLMAELFNEARNQPMVSHVS